MIDKTIDTFQGNIETLPGQVVFGPAWGPTDDKIIYMSITRNTQGKEISGGEATVHLTVAQVKQIQKVLSNFIKFNSVDKNGKYCGLNESTGKMEPAPVGMCGYCGPHCGHCQNFRVYAKNKDGVWTCAADADEAGN